LEQAELTIIDLPMYRRITLSDLIDQGAEAGYDYDLTILNNLTARRMISESPLGRLSHLEDCLQDLPLRTSIRVDHLPTQLNYKLGQVES
jgi:hypothetical protein